MLTPFLLAFRGQSSIERVSMVEGKQIADVNKGGVMGGEKVFKV